MQAFSRFLAQFPMRISATAGQHGRRHPKTIDGARESAIYGHDMPLPLHFSTAVKCGCCVDICRGLRLDLWKSPRKNWDLAKVMEMECPHLTVYRKAPMKSLIVPENGGLPCGIDVFQVLPTEEWSVVANLMSWEMCWWSWKGSHTSQWVCTWADNVITYRTHNESTR